MCYSSRQMGYERKQIASLAGYQPGKQPSQHEALKLNTNENAYPPSPAVLATLRGIEPLALRRYPPPTADALRATAAETHGVSLENVIAVNGSDELLRLAVTTFVDPGRPISLLEPSYSLYPVLAGIHGSPLCTLELRDDWSWPLSPEALAAHFNAQGVQLAMLVNPHAPSGRLFELAAVSAFARALDGVLLLDEAYVDFVDPALGHDAATLIAEHDNLVLSRSFSKGYSLAGLRVGYGLGAATLIEPMLYKTRDVYNVDAIAQRLASVALQDRAYAADTWQKVRAERARMTRALGERGFACIDSQTNFVLARAPQGNAAALQDGLEQAGILVRHFDTPRLRDHLRITVGTPEENTQLLSALDQLLSRD